MATTVPITMFIIAFIVHDKNMMMVSCLADKTAKTLFAELRRASQWYSARGFIVNKVVTDSEECFAATSIGLEGARMTVGHSPPNKHVHKIEVTIRVMKERVRALLLSFPYILPKKLIPSLSSSKLSSMRLLSYFSPCKG